MSLLSPVFAAFLLAGFAAYFAAPKALRPTVLLAASGVFYCLVGGVASLAAVAGVSAAVWAAGLWAGGWRGRGLSRGLRRIPVAVGCAAAFGALIVLKHGGLIFPARSHGAGLLAVVGISFYALQAAGYLVDVYAGKAAAERSPFKLLLFLAFFPQLTQGPIARYNETAADLFAGHGWDAERARRGLQRIMTGYFMKLLIADRLAPAVNTVYGDYAAYGGAMIAFATLLYSVQIYADFAGGVAVAAGIGEIFGVRLPQNFRQPFFAASIADFWRRWHITLGAWLRDYLFYPIAISRPFNRLGMWARRRIGSRVGKLLPATLATFAVYVVMGVWHGASWQGFAFGVLNGVLIAASQFAEPLLKRVTGKVGGKTFWRAFGVVRTLGLLILLRYFARAASMSDALGMLNHTFLHPRLRELWQGLPMAVGLSAGDYAVAALAAAIILLRDILAERGKDPLAMLNAARPVAQCAVTAAVLAAILYFGVFAGAANSAAFIYGPY